MLIEGSFGELNEKQKEVLTHIQGSGKLMASSIEDYLSISRIESGNMKYEYNDFNLKELAEQLVDELRNDATAKGLLLLYKSDINGQGIVHADKGKVYQILHNLINNSIKYTPKGTITVFVTDDIKTKMISVQITDTGIGMNQATLAKLFEKFSRAENANEVNIKGTGLGLYVARALARAMNGEVSAASEGDGKGSTFTFTIPYVL
jgi:signal transduction histidine kinase